MSEINSSKRHLTFRWLVRVDREIWMDIPGYEGLYQASTHGRIKSLERIIIAGKGARRKVEEKILSQVDCHGRSQIFLCKGHGTKKKRFFVHTLVLLTFIGLKPEGMMCCHFPDRNPKNCNLNNLRWDTGSANQEDSRKHGTMRKNKGCSNPLNRGARNGSAKLNENDVRQMRNLYETRDYTFTKLSKMFGVRIQQTCDIIRRKRWKWLT